MGVLQEAVHQRQDHQLVVDFGKTLDQIHGDFAQDGFQHEERLNKTHQVEMLYFVLLTNRAPPERTRRAACCPTGWMPSCPMRFGSPV
jgi:hypothetical protein